MSDTPNHGSVPEARLRREVKVRRLYEVSCELASCNGNSDEGEIMDDRREADDARENHIQMHLQGHFG